MESLESFGKNILLFSFLVFTCCTFVKSQNVGGADIVHKWNSVEFLWPNSSMRDEYIRTGKYVRNNNVVTGLQVYKDKVYVTVPRWRPGVPSALNLVIKNQDGSSVLQPFPNWMMQEIGNCDKFQYVQSMAIDPNTAYMWIIDSGRVNILDSQPKNLCPAKLVIYDINAENIVMKYEFPDSVVSRTSNLLNAIVLDYVDGEARYAYITDTEAAKIHVFDYQQKTSYSFQHASMNSEKSGINLTIGNDVLPAPTPVNGIAISPDFKLLYYCALGGLSLYRVPTKVLRERGNFNSGVEKVGLKISQTDGMVFGQNYLYYGALNMTGIYKWDQSQNTMTSANQKPMVSDATNMRYVDTISFDENGNLWFVTNSLLKYFLGQKTSSTVDYIHIWKISTDDKSYLWTAKQRTMTSASNNNGQNNASTRNGISSCAFIAFIAVVFLFRKT